MIMKNCSSFTTDFVKPTKMMHVIKALLLQFFLFLILTYNSSLIANARTFNNST